MTQLLKQSTAAAISFGPFVDKTDGVTPEIGLVSALDHGSTGILLSKNGGALTIRHASVTASTYDAYGNYIVTLDTTDTNTLGRLRVQFIETATCLPVWQDFTVVPANIFASLVGGSDLLDVSVVQVNGVAQTATLDNIAGYIDTEVAAIKAKTDQLVFTVTNQVDANALTGAPAASAIADAVWDEDITGHSTTDSAGEALQNAGGAGTPPTAEENAAALLAAAYEDAESVQDFLRLARAVLAGAVSGQPSSPEFLSADGMTTRVSATVDGDGNRSGVTVDPS